MLEKEQLEDITNNLDTNLVTTGVFIDLRYCFKLDKKYLTNRNQIVLYNDICSDYRTILCGIPQDSKRSLFVILFAVDTHVFQQRLIMCTTMN